MWKAQKYFPRFHAGHLRIRHALRGAATGGNEQEFPGDWERTERAPEGAVQRGLRSGNGHGRKFRHKVRAEQSVQASTLLQSCKHPLEFVL